MCESNSTQKNQNNKSHSNLNFLNEISNKMTPYFSSTDFSNKSIVIDLLANRIEELNKKIEQLVETKIILKNKTKTLKEIITKLNIILKGHSEISNTESTKKRNIIIKINQKVKELILKSKESISSQRDYSIIHKSFNKPSFNETTVSKPQGSDKEWLITIGYIIMVYFIWTWIVNGLL